MESKEWLVFIINKIELLINVSLSKTHQQSKEKEGRSMTKNSSNFCGICKATINSSTDKLDWIVCEYCGQAYHGDHILNYDRKGFCAICSKSLLKGINMEIYKITGIVNGELEFQLKRKIDNRLTENTRSGWTNYFGLVIIFHVLAIGWLIIWGILLIPFYGVGFILLAIVPFKIWLTKSLSSYNRSARKLEIFLIIMSIMIFNLHSLIYTMPLLTEFLIVYLEPMVLISIMSDYTIFRIPFGIQFQNNLSISLIIPIFQLYVLLFHKESVKKFQSYNSINKRVKPAHTDRPLGREGY
ncbi:MAG: hypothetical protein HeimC2_05110 [Candidatus Heimdallarchaeota archaeon LC_2]|nr:MAG: hypothetical protein HeimC2_05110 [Candidatus Heimdallarchaeota archaeon LC_2]